MLYLISQRQLLPGIVILGSFILFVLWLVGLIVISVELWGANNINSNCSSFVKSTKGPSQQTLAYLEQHSICTWLIWGAFPPFSDLVHLAHLSSHPQPRTLC